MSNCEYGNLPSSRDEALSRGLDRYFTGIPCKHGHVAPRYAKGTSCIVCQVDHARRIGGWKARPSKAAYLDQVRKVIEQRGGVLVSTQYLSAKASLTVLCADKHEFRVTADNLKHGRWCRECKRQNQAERSALRFRSVEELRDLASRRHKGDCLATSPTSVHTRVMWKCEKPEHVPFLAAIAKVIYSHQWCPKCWQERRKPPKPAIPFDVVISTVRQRGGEVVKIGKDGIWTGSKTRLVVRCGNGHEWAADASNLIYAGSWCPECLNKGERIVRAIFEATFGVKFPKLKPEWILSRKGRKLELDGYSEEKRIAFEYQGPHHNSVDYVIAHDAIKRAACTASGVQLIEVEAIKRPYPATNVLNKVIDAFEKAGITTKPRLPDGEIFAAEIRELQWLACQKGGRLISPAYLGGEPHEWKCKIDEHPSWLAESWRVRRGAWCSSCAGNRRLGLDGLRSWGLAIGLDLLDTKYLGGTTAVYQWRCHREGHIIRRSRPNILQSVARGIAACPACAGTRPASTANTAARHIAPPATPGRARRPADSRTG
jgi:hypothetical protein